MNAIESRFIPLVEHIPTPHLQMEIPYTIGEMLWQQYQTQVKVEFPSPVTQGQWRLTNNGWAGFILLSTDLVVSLQPKVALSNLFYMLEYAYRLQSFEFRAGLVGCTTLEEFYESLALVLARRILDRGRKGLYRAYVPETEQLPYVRGRLDIGQAIRTPWDIRLNCHYEEHTADIEDNQLLAWTLLTILRSGMCTERVLPTVRKSYWNMQSAITPVPYNSEACIGRLYNRLNEDYRPLHALCRFFLDHSGPSHQIGERLIMPFLVNMARLYELFVAEWLKSHLPSLISMSAQERFAIGTGGHLHFDMDLVLTDEVTGTTVCVMDTKYKTPSSPDPKDIAQVVTYAEAKRCREAILIYPNTLSHPLDAAIGNIRVRSLTFSLEGDLEQNGLAFMQSLPYHP